ncbi:MAG: isochorismate synthase [Dehalococcoidia bacterium]|nr:isochorismate synthase [Dehalococcoidia bacterium]
MASSIDAGEVLARIESHRRSAAPDAFLALTLPPDFDPRRLLDDPQGAGVVASYERPSQGIAMVAIGEAARIEAPWGAGPGAVGVQARALVDRPGGGDLPGLRPRLLGGFRFNASAAPHAPWEAFGAGWLVLPRVLFLATGESNALILAPSAEAHDVAALVERAQRAPDIASATALRVEQPMDRGRWLASVATIAAEVRAGLYEKAVLASTQQLAGDAPISVGRALARLREDYPDCHLFTMTSGDATFLGASPELLVSLTRGRVRALGLAGSARRGVDPEEDERLGAALLESAKNRIEHETVVRAIRERLGGATEELLAPNQPQLRRLHNIQHLSTEISGRVRTGVDVLDLVERLHPTPAVCGWPADRAGEVIARHEAFDRGWYAGPVGWMDGAGDGEFAVGLRSAVVRGSRAWLFAGNGIMGDSAPQSELDEVQLKFLAVGEALGA